MEELRIDPQPPSALDGLMDLRTYKSAFESDWVTVSIPTGEEIELTEIYSGIDDQFTIHVR